MQATRANRVCSVISNCTGRCIANFVGVGSIFSLLKRFIKFIKMAQLQERLPP